MTESRGPAPGAACPQEPGSDVIRDVPLPQARSPESEGRGLARPPAALQACPTEVPRFTYPRRRASPLLFEDIGQRGLKRSVSGTDKCG